MGSVSFDQATMEMTTIKDGYFWQNPLSAGIRVSVPLFSGLTKMNRSREIKNQISQIGLQRTYARQQVDVQVRSALNDLLTARETMYAQELTVEQARKAYSISDTRYRAGGGYDPRAQQRPAGADAGAAQLLAGDLRLPDGQGRVRPHRRQGKIAWKLKNKR